MKDLLKGSKTPVVKKTKVIKLFTVAYQGENSINSHAVKGQAEALKAAFSIALLEQTGFIKKMTAAGTITASGKAGDVAMLIGKGRVKGLAKALKHLWTVTNSHAVLIGKDNKLNGKGQTFLHNRLSDSGPAFNTSKELVAPFREMIRKGTPVDIKGFTATPIKPHARNFEVVA